MELTLFEEPYYYDYGSADTTGCGLGEGRRYTVDVNATSTQNLEGEVNAVYGEDGTTLLEMDVRAVTGQNDILPDIYYNLDPDQPCSRYVNDILADFLATTWPDIFNENVQVAGLWWMIDLDNLYEAEGLDPEDLRNELGAGVLSEITEEEYYELLDDLNKVAQKYIFTDKEEDMVLVMQEVLAENTDFRGTNTHKYAVEVDLRNLKRYAQDSLQAFKDSSIYDKLIEVDGSYEEVYEALQTALAEMSITESDQIWLDELGIILWVSTDTSLIRNIRFFAKEQLPSGVKEPADDGSVDYVEMGFAVEDRTFLVHMKIHLAEGFDLLGEIEVGIDDNQVKYLIHYTGSSNWF